VWSFTIAEFLVVDDFESYNELNEDEPGSNRIFDTWIDGFGTWTNGALVGYLDIPGLWWPKVRSGFQSMQFSYDNYVGISEATAHIDNLAIGRDWTIKGDSAEKPLLLDF